MLISCREGDVVMSQAPSKNQYIPHQPHAQRPFSLEDMGQDITQYKQVETERKQMQEQLRASEKRFRALIEKSSDAIVLVDTNGKLLYVSPSTTRLLGYMPDELVGRIAFELIHPDDVETTVQVLATIVREPGKSLRAEFRARHQNGA